MLKKHSKILWDTLTKSGYKFYLFTDRNYLFDTPFQLSYLYAEFMTDKRKLQEKNTIF